MDVDEIVEELNKLKMFSPEEYKEKLALLKSKNPSIYNQVISILGVEDSKIPVIKPQKSDEAYKIFNEKGNKAKIRRSNGLGTAIIGVMLVGFVIIGIIFLFILFMPSITPTNFNATQAVIVGYNLFSSINTTYLQYSYALNYSISGTESSLMGREYYIAGENKFTMASYNVLNGVTEYYNVIKNEGNMYYTDLNAQCSAFEKTEAYSTTTTLNALFTYNELHSIVINNLVLNSSREDLWELNGEQCVPLQFQVDIASGSALYEICLNNDGIPLAIGKYVNMGNFQSLYVAYLESTNSPLLGLTDLDGKTLNEWNSEELNCP